RRQRQRDGGPSKTGLHDDELLENDLNYELRECETLTKNQRSIITPLFRTARRAGERALGYDGRMSHAHSSIDPKDFRVREGHRVHLNKWPTLVNPFYESKDDYHEQLQRHASKLERMQGKLYASDSYSLLLIFQGMDTAGKDGVIKHVMS